MSFLLVPLALLAGMLNTVQSGTNSALNKALGQPLIVTLVVVAGNLVAYLAVGLVTGVRWPAPDKLAAVPWWAWTGGLCGAAYVLAVIFCAEKLGAALFIGSTVTAGIITSVALDHFGLIGFKQHTAGIGRIVGCVLMIGGLTLISLF